MEIYILSMIMFIAAFFYFWYPQIVKSEKRKQLHELQDNLKPISNQKIDVIRKVKAEGVDGLTNEEKYIFNSVSTKEWIKYTK